MNCSFLRPRARMSPPLPVGDTSSLSGKEHRVRGDNNGKTGQSGIFAPIQVISRAVTHVGALEGFPYGPRSGKRDARLGSGVLSLFGALLIHSQRARLSARPFWARHGTADAKIRQNFLWVHPIRARFVVLSIRVQWLIQNRRVHGRMLSAVGADNDKKRRR